MHHSVIPHKADKNYAQSTSLCGFMDGIKSEEIAKKLAHLLIILQAVKQLSSNKIGVH